MSFHKSTLVSIGLSIMAFSQLSMGQSGANRLFQELIEESRSSEVNYVMANNKQSNKPLADLEYYEVLDSESIDIEKMVRQASNVIELKMSFKGEEFNLTLGKTEPKIRNLVINTSSGEPVSSEPSVHYRGVVNGHVRSIATLSAYGDELRVLISTPETGNIRCTKTRYGHLIYSDHNLVSTVRHSCSVVDSEINDDIKDLSKQLNTKSFESMNSCEAVGIFFECDYEFFLDMGSNTSAVLNHLYALFNEVQTLYYNEYIPIEISEVFIWNWEDYYSSIDNSFDLLESFKNLTPDFDGRLAHFLTTRSIGGGRAYTDVLCSNSENYGVSGSISTFSVNEVPDYSWSVNVIAHELGHNFGSPHTHSCEWSGGNQIDDCGNLWITSNGSDDDNDGFTDELDEAEGDDCYSSSSPIIPSNGGTIMSYCHLNGTGMNFSLGFGSQPGNLIRSRFGACSQLNSCNTWVDYDYFGTENGSFTFPFNTLSEAVNAVQDGGVIYIKSSSDDETIDIDLNKSFIIRTWEGASIVGQ